jgi:hypothetical protein
MISNWKMQVQVEATALFLRYYRAGANPTISSTKEDLSKWCRANGVLTDSGIVPSGEYRSNLAVGATERLRLARLKLVKRMRSSIGVTPTKKTWGLAQAL